MQRVPRASFFLTTQRRLCGGELQLTSKGGTMHRTRVKLKYTATRTSTSLSSVRGLRLLSEWVLL